MADVKKNDVVKLLEKVKVSVNEERMELSDKEIDERIENLEKARVKLEDVIGIIRDAVIDTGIIEDRSELYILPHLENWVNKDYNSIDGIISNLEELKEERADDEEREGRVGRKH